MTAIDRTMTRIGVGAVATGGVAGLGLAKAGDHDNPVALDVLGAAGGAFLGAVVTGGVGFVGFMALGLGGPNVLRNPIAGMSAITVGAAGLAFAGAGTTAGMKLGWGQEW